MWRCACPSRALHKAACVGKRALGYAIAQRLAVFNRLDLKDSDGMVQYIDLWDLYLQFVYTTYDVLFFIKLFSIMSELKLHPWILGYGYWFIIDSYLISTAFFILWTVCVQMLLPLSQLEVNVICYNVKVNYMEHSYSFQNRRFSQFELA